MVRAVDNKGLLNLRFDNRFVASLPADKETSNFVRQVYAAAYSFVKPKKTAQPSMLSYSNDVAELLGIPDADCRTSPFTDVFSGNALLDGMQPYAMCYGGHQFGQWAGQLGDGRAINLGEVKTEAGRHYTLQLKGAGPTPYSRSADGLAVLRSSVREYLCSEAMHYLGVPTTRALSLAITGDQVLRDMFYNGNAKMEPGAVVCRVASSFTRFGNFEIFSAREDYATLEKLLEHTIQHDFPHLQAIFAKDKKAAYLKWFTEVADRTVNLMVDWMRVGFVHGVMNTDNLSILGLTIDYGPYGWLDNFDQRWTPNTTDAQGRRYCYMNQPAIGQWNLAQLANAIYPLIKSTDELEAVIAKYREDYESRWLSMMRNKLGLADAEDSDRALIDGMQNVLEACEIDFTLFFKSLEKLDVNEKNDGEILFLAVLDSLYQPESLDYSNKQKLIDWLKQYCLRTNTDSATAEARKRVMAKTNPWFILRNYLSQLAIEKAERGDYLMIGELLTAAKAPYQKDLSKPEFYEKRPEWAKEKAGCSMLSCSS